MLCTERHLVLSHHTQVAAVRLFLAQNKDILRTIDLLRDNHASHTRKLADYQARDDARERHER